MRTKSIEEIWQEKARASRKVTKAARSCTCAYCVSGPRRSSALLVIGQ